MARDRWSKDFPTEDGFYWSRWPGCPIKENKVVRGVPIMVEDGYIYTTAMGQPFSIANMRREVMSEFYGPIEPPPDNNKEAL